MAVCFYFYPLLDERYKSVIILLNMGEYMRFFLNKCLFFSFFNKELFIIYIVLSACISEGQKREPDLITDGCEPQCGCGELTPGHLEKQWGLLTSEPSLHPITVLGRLKCQTVSFILWCRTVRCSLWCSKIPCSLAWRKSHVVSDVEQPM